MSAEGIEPLEVPSFLFRVDIRRENETGWTWVLIQRAYSEDDLIAIAKDEVEQRFPSAVEARVVNLG